MRVVEIGIVAQGLKIGEGDGYFVLKMKGMVDVRAEVDALLGSEGFENGNGEDGLMKENAMG